MNNVRRYKKTKGKISHKVLAILLAVTLLFSSMPISMMEVSADTGTADTWNGTSADTDWYYEDTDATSYEISTAAELSGLSELLLYEVATFADVTITLTADIDLNNEPWTEIGNPSGNDFEGIFDGDGHTISGLYIDSSYSYYQGLFGCTDGATIKNLGVINPNISADTFVGAIVGYAVGTTIIENCYTSGGSVTGKGDNVGGVVGYLVSGAVTNCYNIDTAVTGNNMYIGGIVGQAQGTVSNCYNTGNVSSKGIDIVIDEVDMLDMYGIFIGGVVGEASAAVTNCYSVGDVTIEDENIMFMGDDIIDISSLTYKAGGVVGYSSSTITNCYYDSRKITDTSILDSTKDGIVGDNLMTGEKAVEDMGLSDEIWQATDSYPVLKSSTSNTDESVTIDISEYGYIVFTEDGVYSYSYYDKFLGYAFEEVELAAYEVPIILTGTKSEILIAVESGTHDITFSDVNANSSATYGSLYIAGGVANVTVADDTVNTFNGHLTDIVVLSGATLNIDGGTENTGVLTVNDDTDWNWSYGSGIGSYCNGSSYEECGTITISGATVNAYGSSGGAAIGGSGATITIDDNAIVNATSAGAGAAIGNSQDGIATDITITGSADVTAVNSSTMYSGGSAIGGAYTSVTGNITISGNSKVYASSTTGTAIGGGYSSSAGNILISGNATVTANGGTNSSDDGAGIGSGKFYKGTEGTITIQDYANVTATGGSFSAGIGTAQSSYIDTINITGGIVNATGGVDAYGFNDSGAGIGTGYYGSVNEINISGGRVTAYGKAYSAAIGGGCQSYGGEISITDTAYVVAVPANAGFAIGNGNEFDGTGDFGYNSAGTNAVIYIESASNFKAYSTDYFGDCTFTNTGDVEFIQINYFSNQVGEDKTTEIKNSEGNSITSFSSSRAYTGIILGIDSAYADDTYTVYYDGEIQMHKNELSEGQVSTDFTITDGYSYYTNVEDAEYPEFANDYIDFDVDMDYTDANVSLVVYAYNVLNSTNSYQWQINTDDGFVNIDGATSGEYTVPQTTVVGTYEYRVVLTSKYNYNGGVPMTQVVSDVITLTVGQADNEITGLSIDGWIYGEYDEKENSPTATATDGTISYTYYSDIDCEKEVEDITTANVGTYYVVASVEESDNYKAGTSDVESFTISVKELETTDISIEDIEESYIFTNSELEPIPTIMYGDIELVQDTDYEVTYSSNTDVSTDTATIIITFIGNYSGETSTTFDIVYADVATDSYAVTTDDWTNVYEITAADGYKVSTSVDEVFGDSITVTTDSETTDGTEVTFYIENTDGTIAQKTVTCKLDTVDPTVTVEIESNSFKEFINNITFNLFFKNTVDVKIEGTDTLSGVASVEYQKVATTDDYNEDGIWISKDSFSVEPTEIFVVYAKITDKAGNVTIVNSTSITAYTDSTPETASFDFVKSGEDTNKTVEVELNGNTISSITYGERTVSDSNYTISEEVDGVTTITFLSTYLGDFVGGTYTFIVNYNPLGESYVDTQDNEAPTSTTITANIYEVITDNTVTKQSTGYNSTSQSPVIPTAETVDETLVIKYQDDNGDYTLTEIPSFINVGTYTVNYELSADNHITAYGEISLEIIKANPSYEIPTGLESTYGDTLAGVTLPSGFAFEDELTTPVGETGINTFMVTYTPNDTNSYNVITGIEVSIKVSIQEVEVTGNADVSIAPEVESQLLEELFTEEDVSENTDLKVSVKVDIVETENMDKTSQAQFDKYLESYSENLAENEVVTQATIFDISVIKSLAGVEENITELKTPIRIIIDIPQEYQDEDREFFILRNHDGEITILEDLDVDPTTITIETDRFSNYTLNYTETAEAESETPDTGDNSSPQTLIVIMFVSLFGVFVVGKKRLAKFY
ncbi:MAG: GLUG motif-containing protein [Clostridia bacterium]